MSWCFLAGPDFVLGVGAGAWATPLAACVPAVPEARLLVVTREFSNPLRGLGSWASVKPGGAGRAGDEDWPGGRVATLLGCTPHGTCTVEASKGYKHRHVSMVQALLVRLKNGLLCVHQCRAQKMQQARARGRAACASTHKAVFEAYHTPLLVSELLERVGGQVQVLHVSTAPTLVAEHVGRVVARANVCDLDDEGGGLVIADVLAVQLLALHTQVHTKGLLALLMVQAGAFKATRERGAGCPEQCLPRAR